MVKKIISTIILITINIALFASSGADINISGLFSNNGNTSNIFYATVSPYYNFSDQDLKGEVKGEITYTNTKDLSIISLSLKRADFRFRLPSFNGKKMTIVAGRSPISWGVGTYYRIGDVLLDNLSKNEKAGSNDSRNIWLLSASQSLGSGFSIDVATSLPLSTSINFTQYGSTIEKTEKLAIGTKIKKSFNLDTLKSVQVSASYNEDKIASLAAAFDIALYFDITTGIETKFRSCKDIRYVINMMKLYNIEGEINTYSIGLYLAGELNFYSSLYESFFALSFTPAERINLYLALTNQFSDTDFVSLMLTPSISVVISNSVKLEVAGIYNYQKISDTNLFGASLSLKASF